MLPAERTQHATSAGRGNLNDLQKLLSELAAPSGGVPLAGPFAIADLPDAASYPYTMVACSNGAAGDPCVAYSTGSEWVNVSGAALAAS